MCIDSFRCVVYILGEIHHQHRSRTEQAKVKIRDERFRSHVRKSANTEKNDIKETELTKHEMRLNSRSWLPFLRNDNAENDGRNHYTIARNFDFENNTVTQNKNQKKQKPKKENE